MLECKITDTGNPRAHSIQWTHNGVRIDRPLAVEEPLQNPLYNDPTRGNGGNSVLLARFRTTIADKNTAGQYGCAAVNELGEGLWDNFRLEVKCKYFVVDTISGIWKKIETTSGYYHRL